MDWRVNLASIIEKTLEMITTTPYGYLELDEYCIALVE